MQNYDEVLEKNLSEDFGTSHRKDRSVRIPSCRVFTGVEDSGREVFVKMGQLIKNLVWANLSSPGF